MNNNHHSSETCCCKDFFPHSFEGPIFALIQHDHGPFLPCLLWSPSMCTEVIKRHLPILANRAVPSYSSNHSWCLREKAIDGKRQRHHLMFETEDISQSCKNFQEIVQLSQIAELYRSSVACLLHDKLMPSIDAYPQPIHTAPRTQVAANQRQRTPPQMSHLSIPTVHTDMQFVPW